MQNLPSDRQLDITASQLQQLCQLAEEAATEVMAVYATDFSATIKEDRSPLTEADLRADRVIREGLARMFPEIAVISEEHIPCELPAYGQPFFLVDPLDGTKEFVARTGEFTINIALVRAGAPVAGIVLAPAQGRLFFAAKGVGAFCRSTNGEQRISTCNYDPGAALRIVGSRSHGGARLAEWVSSLTVPHRFEPAGSSLKICRVAEGAADLYPRLGPTSLWDTAAAQCVLEQAGGHLTDLTGQRLRYQTGAGWLNPEFVAWADAACLAFCANLPPAQTCAQ